MSLEVLDYYITYLLVILFIVFIRVISLNLINTVFWGIFSWIR